MKHLLLNEEDGHVFKVNITDEQYDELNERLLDTNDKLTAFCGEIAFKQISETKVAVTNMTVIEMSVQELEQYCEVIVNGNECRYFIVTYGKPLPSGEASQTPNEVDAEQFYEQLNDCKQVLRSAVVVSRLDQLCSNIDRKIRFATNSGRDFYIVSYQK